MKTVKQAQQDLKDWNDRHPFIPLNKKWKNKDYRRLRQQLQLASHATKTFKAKSSNSHKVSYQKPGPVRDRMIAGNKKHAKAKSIKMKKLWANEEFRDARVAAFVKASHKPRHKSALEDRVTNLLILLQFDQTYQYNGLRGKKIGPYEPDFVDWDRKKIIEAYSVRYHANRTDKDKERILYLGYKGFEVLVVWDKDFNQLSKLINRVIKFDKS